MPLSRPSPEEETALLESPQLRAERYADRLDEHSNDPNRKIRGVKRPELGFIAIVSELSIDPIHPNVVKALDRKLGKNRPVFDRFTRHYRIYPPSKDKINTFIFGAQNKNKQWSSDHEEQRRIIADRKRQPKDIEDNMQRTVFRDLLIAKWRKASIGSVLHGIESGKTFDSEAQMAASDAMIDFGYCLMESRNQFLIDKFKFFPLQPSNRGVGEVTGPLIGAHIAFIGKQSEVEPSLLRLNPALLELVAGEQEHRINYWNKIYTSTFEFFGDRLNKPERNEEAWVNSDIDRLANLDQAA